MSNNFEALLKELGDVAAEHDTMAKAMPEPPADNPEDDEDGEDDAAIAAAADAGGAAPAADDAPAFGKSFEFTDAAGATHEAVDATDLVKSLIGRLDTSEEVLAKALTSMAGSMKAQGDLIKSLTAQVQALSSQGRGRKAMLSVVEKPAVGDTMAKSQPDSITPEQFFAKANAAFDAGKISGKELNVVSVSLRGNHPIEPGLIQKIALA